MENFESEKQKIKNRVILLFRIPLKNLCANLPEISPEYLEEIMTIFTRISNKFPKISRQDFCNLSAAFPAFLTEILPDFSEKRIELLAEIVFEISMERQITLVKLPDDPE